LESNIDLKISELRLDHDNPRISTEDGQINIRQALLDDQGSKIAELASDIARFGLNPMDRMMVLQQDPKKKEYITLEGNRRTAALQILANPALLEDMKIPDTLRNKLTRIIHEKCAVKAKPLISFTTMRMGCLMKFFAMKSLAQVFGGLGRFRAVR